MSKKGLISIVKNDKVKATYIHRNAQLEGIGKRVVRLCKENTLEELNALYDALILVDEDTPMTQEQKEAYKKYMPEQLYRDQLYYCIEIYEGCYFTTAGLFPICCRLCRFFAVMEKQIPLYD